MKEILFAGAGGQGVLTAGDIVADVAKSEGYKTTWAPEYGSAMRGGDANCTVKISEGLVYNPTREAPDILLAMNQSSLDKFIDLVRPGGVVLLNSDMVEGSKVDRDDVELVEVACMTMAKEIGNPKGANIIMTAIIIKLLGLFTEEEGLEAMNEMFRKAGKEKFEKGNTEAFKLGYSYI